MVDHDKSRWTLIDSTNPFEVTATDAQVPRSISTTSGKFAVEWKRLVGGKQANVEVLSIDTGAINATILPTRGMGLWKCKAGDVELGWTSPVRGPIHPSFVPVFDPSGIGWLEGFDELLVRCGLQSNGAPDFDERGHLKYPLHGRIANLAAHALSIEVDAANGTLDIIGSVMETRFLIYSLELQTRYRFRVGSPVIEVSDTVTNRLATPTSMQMLYHINLGQPILQSGSTAYIPTRALSPRDQRAADGIDVWHKYSGPEMGFCEQVYLIEPSCDEHRWSEAMLCTADESMGFAVHYDTRTLPYFNLWKNTGAIEDGYVTGLEPATGFPNPRTFEEQHGRLVHLQGGESRTFRLKLQPLVNAQDVEQSKQRIGKLQDRDSKTYRDPRPGCSSQAAHGGAVR